MHANQAPHKCVMQFKSQVAWLFIKAGTQLHSSYTYCIAMYVFETHVAKVCLQTKHFLKLVIPVVLTLYS